MQNPSVSPHDTHDRSTGGGLFSHPDTDHLETSPASAPDEEQRSYTDLFREPE